MPAVIKRILMFLGILFTGMLACQRSAKVDPVVKTAFRMDTLVKISVFDSTKNEQDVKALMDSIYQWMENAENKLSVHVDNSEIQKINQAANQKKISVSKGVYDVIQAGKKMTSETSGSFDITIGAVKTLWDFHNNRQLIPDEKDIKNQLKTVNADFIELNDQEVFLKHAGVRLDLGGIAKGYMVDCAVEMLRKADIQAAIVEAGGDLRILGNHPNKPMWRIGIRHPRQPHGLYGILQVDSVSVTTSGDYERYFEKDGKRYHHILDPETGYPASKSISVTIVTQSAMKADALATALFVMGPQKGIEYAEQHSDVECLILYEKNGKILSQMSSGMKAIFKPL